MAHVDRDAIVLRLYTQMHIYVYEERDARAIYPRRLPEHKRIDGA